MTGQPLCWICEQAPADSGEHKAKRSDLRDVHGAVSQSRPLFLNDAKNKNRKVGSLSADVLKWKKSLCHRCNSTLTQPHDLAWEAMSQGLREWTPPLRAGSVVRANRIFPIDTARSMLAVHLYFVKELGCLAVEAGNAAKLDVRSLAAAIKSGRAHSDIYFGIGIPQQFTRGPIISADDLHVITDKVSGALEMAWWHYNVNGICVQVVWIPSGPGALILVRKERLWHPRVGSNRLEVKDFSGEPSQSI